LIDASEYYSKDELINLTQELIRIPSHKDIPNQEKDIAEFILNFCKSNDIECELQHVVDDRYNVLAYLRGDGTGRSIMLNGHTDTVPPYDMKIKPYAAEIRDGFIWGRGASDMKGGLASMLITIVALKRSGIKLKGDVIFTGVIGEEGKSEGTEYIIKSGIKAHGAIVGEPSNYKYTIGHRGLEWLEIVVKGKAAHGGVPHMGINAIEKAINLILRIQKELYPELEKRYNKYMGPSVMNIGEIEGGNQPSTVADTCSIKIDRRYVNGETVNSILKEYQRIIDEIKNEDPQFDAEVRIMEDNYSNLQHPPLFTRPNKPIVKALRASIKDVLGHEATVTKCRGWTDAALLSKYGKIPSVVYGPGDIKYSHTQDERVPIKELVDSVTVYSNTIQRFCGIKY